jgi:hypothetical protein
MAECEDPQERPGTVGLLREVLDRFAGSVVSFYDEGDRTNGWIEAMDRNDTLRRFSMLSVSVGVLRLCVDDGHSGGAYLQPEKLGEILAVLKKDAKLNGGYAYQEGLVPLSHSTGQDALGPILQR